MMQAFTREPTRSTPEVRLDPQAGLALMRGSSYPENASSFYQPIFDWVKNYLQHLNRNDQGRLHLDLEIVYLNSSSSKVFMMLFDLLEDAAAAGADVAVTWRYHPENETAHECGEELKEDYTHLIFTMQAVERMLEF